MTLPELYASLPEATYPKKEMIEDLAKRCQVTISTAEKWVRGYNQPISPLVLQKISKITGIPKDELFKPRKDGRRKE